MLGKSLWIHLLQMEDISVIPTDLDPLSGTQPSHTFTQIIKNETIQCVKTYLSMDSCFNNLLVRLSNFL